jgi:hypothetical protein
MKPVSLVFKSVEGDYVCLKDVLSIRKEKFRDELGTATELSSSVSTPVNPLYLRTEHQIHLIDLSDLFNIDSAGVDKHKRRHFDESIEDEVERYILEKWCELRYGTDAW